MKISKVRDPYCLLFCLGFVSALQGSLLWTLFQAQWISFFPRQAHANLMIFGFLTAFISGFLMTAVPRMTGSAPARRWEIFGAAILIVLQWFLNGLNLITASTGVFFLQVAVLILFFVQRVSLKKQTPPEGFVFIPFAFVSALMGPVAIWVPKIFPFLEGPESFQWLYLWTGQAFILNLICGLGSRLIPVLARLPGALPMTAPRVQPAYKEMFIKALLLNITFILEAAGFDSLGLLLRAAWLLWFALGSLHIMAKPTTRSHLGTGVKSACAFIFLGYLLAGVFPAKHLNFLHLVFIGGFSLITLMVATRVVLAHGGKSLEIEIKSSSLVAILILFLLSGISRASISPLHWQQGVFLAVAAFAFAMGLWMLFFGRHVFSRPC